MTKQLLCLVITFVCAMQAMGQGFNPRKMTYFNTTKPNTIIYNDTLYSGSKQFKALFLRTDDKELIRLYHKHQSNKVWGNIIGTTGAVAIGFGVGLTGNNKTAGWITAGAGFVTLVSGAWLITCGQRDLLYATQLFNARYTKTTIRAGFTGNGVALVANF